MSVIVAMPSWYKKNCYKFITVHSTVALFGCLCCLKNGPFAIST